MQHFLLDWCNPLSISDKRALRFVATMYTPQARRRLYTQTVEVKKKFSASAENSHDQHALFEDVRTFVFPKQIARIDLLKQNTQMPRWYNPRFRALAMF